MRLLLDTHALIWWLGDDPALSKRAARLIAEPANEVLVSAATAFEIATKHRLGKLPRAAAIASGIEQMVVAEGFTPLPVMMAQAELAGRLPAHHRDPFDRLLVAQALLEGLALVSRDSQLAAYGVPLLW